MSCIGVNVKPIVSGVSAIVERVGGIVASACHRVSGVIASADRISSNVAVTTDIVNCDLVVDAAPVDSGLTVTAMLVCGTGLRNEYFLLVDEGYTLTIDGKRIKVLGNG